jgi:DNA-binding CsgD family transcriptional regulator
MIASPGTKMFVERCLPGRLLCFAIGPSGELQSISPGFLGALGGSPDAAQIARLAEGAEPGFSVIATLQLADGIRLFAFSEAEDARLGRQLTRFADAHRLTAAETAALTDIATGASAKESARRLGLSPETVRARRKRIYRKVGADGCGSILARLLQE